MENAAQKEFIESIQITLEKANTLCCDLITAQKITPPNPEACQEYLRCLQSYTNAAQKMILEMNLFFGEDSEVIFTRYCGLVSREPGHLN
jgi:hypothetical protein